ncbi:MAG: helix-turn-helix transcriptional regulator [Planctomycetota bacterium]|jgi:DNA-binding CsgD family transcriptional regulator
MLQQTIAPTDVALAAKITEEIADLPAIATHAWCDDAAGALSGLRDGTIVSVTTGVIDELGRFRRVEEVGAYSDRLDKATLTPLRERFNVVARLGWSLGDPATLARGPFAKCIRDLMPMDEWNRSPQGRLWQSVGATDLVVGAAALSEGVPSRVIVVELGVSAGEASLTAADAAVLSAALGPLSRRAMLAFGASPSETVRRLTPREEEVLEHLALGKSVKQIASELRRSPHTVHDHVKSLHVKLHASSRGELIARALGHLKPVTHENGEQLLAASG